ncbi:ribonuclease Z [Lactiplantibacillus sp. WILCCON 0030]|uniref:Ribonuclease Z n=1 Tax=Lactiplantibacillus brownii TaxID=3069269 RepID=A0ABU1A9A6_9LACO|nr:ribonuclease Z [Lactiplantibacillus brownii]MDQ7937553.1 ribonuclease Z [Lactiplantibacillus brownii]
MQLEFLGTGAGSPGKFRNVTSTALRLLDERNEVWLFDVGEGTQHQILRTTLKPRKITKIFITHLHGDHIFGLPGFLSSRSFQGGDEPLTIYGPAGVKDFVKTSLRVSGTRLSYPLHFEELGTDGVIFEDATFKVSFQHLEHRIECVGYRVEEAAHPGELQADKLKAMQIPSGPLYGRLKAGETVTLPDGRTINGQDFIAAPQPGRIVTILGDTRQTPNAVSLAYHANVLVHESTFGKDEGKLAHNYYHSTSTQAAQVAKQAGVKQLLLTHISARYTGKLAKELQKQAQTIFKNTKVVRDFDLIDIPLTQKA